MIEISMKGAEYIEEQFERRVVARIFCATTA